MLTQYVLTIYEKEQPLSLLSDMTFFVYIICQLV